MRQFVFVAFAALTAVASGASATEGVEQHVNATKLHAGAGHGKQPWGNSTHFFDHRAGRVVQHFADWSNGTHFSDPGTNQTIKHFDCDVHHGQASAHYNATVHRLHLDHANSALGSRAAKALVDRTAPKVSVPITNVPLHIHVITKQSEQGAITQAMAQAQAQELNNAYNPHGISFAAPQIDFTVNDAWAVAAGSDMDALKKALRKGSYEALNLYFHTDLAGGVLGTCTLPATVPKGSAASEYYNDGCSIAAYTMPGSTMLGYNQGKTAVHETGHWLGLLHTFEGYSCSGNGDFIGDTPFESQSTNGCPTSPLKNSCPSVSKGDPIHNFMDYSTDACYSRFTAGQVRRMGAMWAQYRQGM